MNRIVVDSSVAVCWYVRDESPASTKYSQRVFQDLFGGQIVVPVTFFLEFANVLIRCERQERLTSEGVASAHQAMATLRILPAYRCYLAASSTLADLARTHNLEVYDAAYLELALRLQLPLATIDRKLKDAAKAVKVFYDP